MVVGRVPVCTYSHTHANGRTSTTARTPDDAKLDCGRVDLRPLHMILAPLSIHLDPLHLVRERTVRRICPTHGTYTGTRAGAGANWGPYGGFTEGDLESARTSKRTGDVRVDEGVWEEGTGVEEAAEEGEGDVGPGVRRRVRGRCRSRTRAGCGCRGRCRGGRSEERGRRIEEGVYNGRQRRCRWMRDDKGLDERRKRPWVDRMRDKGIAKCRGSYVERDRTRRGNLYRYRHSSLKGELELLAGWAWLGLLLLLWLLLGGMRVRVGVRARTGRGVGCVRRRGKGRREGWTPCEATRSRSCRRR